jgi:hypothetical protein
MIKMSMCRHSGWIGGRVLMNGTKNFTHPLFSSKLKSIRISLALGNVQDNSMQRIMNERSAKLVNGKTAEILRPNFATGKIACFAEISRPDLR